MTANIIFIIKTVLTTYIDYSDNFEEDGTHELFILIPIKLSVFIVNVYIENIDPAAELVRFVLCIGNRGIKYLMNTNKRVS